MNKYKIETLGQCKTDFITVFSSSLPQHEGVPVFNPYPLDTYKSFNMEFIGKYGNRCISKFLDAVIDEYGQDDLHIDVNGLATLSVIIQDRFKKKWQDLYDLSIREYDPLSPFDITLNEKTTNSLNVTEDTSESSSTDSVYAYNSELPAPTDKSENTSTNDYHRENPTTRDYTRKGNIGNTSRQELIEQQRNVLKYQLLDTIYKDIATVLCRGKYIL